jgi:hypothetical protein
MSMSSGARRRPRGTPRRDSVVRVKFTAAERTALEQAADQVGLSLGAYVGQAAMDAAEHRAAPVDDIYRELLGKLMRLNGLVLSAGSDLNQAVARLNSTGRPGLDLAPAAEWIARVAVEVEEASLAVSRTLNRQTR